jgi:hypothetical protein
MHSKGLRCDSVEVENDKKEFSRSREDKFSDLPILNELAGIGILGE